MNPTHSPWGAVQQRKLIAEGIVQVSTASHGGILLSPQRQRQMPACFHNTWAGPGAYEEDCDWAMVAVVFPDFFSAESIAGAVRTIKSYKKDNPDAVAFVSTGRVAEIARQYDEAHANHWRVGSYGTAPRGYDGWGVVLYHRTDSTRIRRGVMKNMPRQSDWSDEELAAEFIDVPKSAF